MYLPSHINLSSHLASRRVFPCISRFLSPVSRSNALNLFPVFLPSLKWRHPLSTFINPALRSLEYHKTSVAVLRIYLYAQSWPRIVLPSKYLAFIYPHLLSRGASLAPLGPRRRTSLHPPLRLTRLSFLCPHVSSSLPASANVLLHPSIYVHYFHIHVDAPHMRMLTV